MRNMVEQFKINCIEFWKSTASVNNLVYPCVWAASTSSTHQELDGNREEERWIKTCTYGNATTGLLWAEHADLPALRETEDRWEGGGRGVDFKELMVHRGGGEVKVWPATWLHNRTLQLNAPKVRLLWVTWRLRLYFLVFGFTGISLWDSASHIDHCFIFC